MTAMEWRRVRLGALIFRYLRRIVAGDTDPRYLRRINRLHRAKETT